MLPQIVKRKTLAPGYLQTIDALHEYAVRDAEKTFRKKGQSPFRWFVRNRQRLIVIDSSWENEREKVLSAKFMRYYMLMLGADAYSFVTEAWVAIPTEAEVKAYQELDIPPPQPSQHPNREDALVVTTYDKNEPKRADGTEAFRMTRWAVRYSSGRPGFGKLLARDNMDHRAENMSLGGRMFGLLDPPREDEVDELLMLVEEFKKHGGRMPDVPDDAGLRKDEPVFEVDSHGQVVIVTNGGKANPSSPWRRR